MLKDVQGEIAFEDVSFNQEVGDEKLLSDVHRYGSMDNVTTVLSAAQTSEEEDSRLYDPISDTIWIDVHHLHDLKLDTLSAQIGMVTQETCLFHDTIRTSLLYARLDASQESYRLRNHLGRRRYMGSGPSPSY